MYKNEMASSCAGHIIFKHFRTSKGGIKVLFTPFSSTRVCSGLFWFWDLRLGCHACEARQMVHPQLYHWDHSGMFSSVFWPLWLFSARLWLVMMETSCEDLNSKCLLGWNEMSIQLFSWDRLSYSPRQAQPLLIFLLLLLSPGLTGACDQASRGLCSQLESQRARQAVCQLSCSSLWR